MIDSVSKLLLPDKKHKYMVLMKTIQKPGIRTE